MAAAHHEIDEDAPAEADVVVCGGGPGGSTFATLMARRGYRTVVFERETFPRFHIGESLLPWNVPLFERIGVLSKLKAAGPQVKLGACFYHQGSDFTHLVMFANGSDRDHPSAFQVKRAALRCGERSAAFAHYDTFRRVEGPTGGDIVVVTTPEVRDLLSGSKRTMDVHAIADYSYSTPRISGDGFFLVGDAADFRDFEKIYRRAVRRFAGLVHGFYEPHVLETFYTPAPNSWIERGGRA